MSLVIHTIVRDGIVVSADTRTTCKDDKGNTRYDDTAEKIIPFPNRIIVTHTGDSMINDKLSVTDFLIDLRKKCGKKITITDLPIKLLKPKYIHDEQRLDDITSAIMRYMYVSKGIPEEWIKEYNELCRNLNK